MNVFVRRREPAARAGGPPKFLLFPMFLSLKSGAASHKMGRRLRAGRRPKSVGDPQGAFMLAKLNTFALVGIEAMPVEVEVDASAGLPKTILVGLPEMAVKESIHRIERAMANLGYQRHPGRLVINLAPTSCSLR
jgi:hypothetical protein